MHYEYAMLYYVSWLRITPLDKVRPRLDCSSRSNSQLILLFFSDLEPNDYRYTRLAQLIDRVQRVRQNITQAARDAGHPEFSTQDWEAALPVDRAADLPVNVWFSLCLYLDMPLTLVCYSDDLTGNWRCEINIPWQNLVNTDNHVTGNLSDQEIEHRLSPIPNSYGALATNSRQRRNAVVDFHNSHSPSTSQPQAISSHTPSSPYHPSLPLRGQPFYESLSDHHLYSVKEGFLEQKPREDWDRATRKRDARR